MHGQPRISNSMHTTLEVAAKHGQVGLRRVHKPEAGRPPWPAHPNTLRALVLRNLLHYERAKHRKGWPLDRWTVTDQGHQALQPVEKIVRDLPVYLARSGGQIKYRKLPNGRVTIDSNADGNGDYTTDASKSIDTDRAPNSRTHTAVCVLVGPRDLDVFAEKALEREQDRLRSEGDRLDNQAISYRLDHCALIASERKMDITADTRKIRHLTSIGRTTPALAHLTVLEQRLMLRAAA